ncbi:hypothetical protein [Burkholderia phage FLC9]|nr:hypothetical protein [Burkholderia phage FLC9]
MAKQTTSALVDNATEKQALSPAEIDRLISKQFKMFIGTVIRLDESLWAGATRNALQAIAELVLLAKKGGVKPSELRRMRIYTVAVDALRSLFENPMIIRMGEEFDFAFALERGFAELLQANCNIIHDRGEMRCKIRFVKAKVETGQFPLYERICIRFDGQYDIQLIDRSRYGS